jgi:serine/threonine-protein kinase
MDIERGSARKLTFEGEADVACWGPDNRSLTFDWVGAVPGDGIFVKSVDTGVEASSLFKNELRRFPIAWTPDGKLLAFMQEKNIWVFHADDQRTEQVTKTPNNILWPTLSPDGRWIAYSSNESGRYEIYVQSFPAPGTRYMLSTEGGSEPVWAPKAQQLYFRNGNKMMVVDFRPEVNNVLAKPRELFEGQYDLDSPIRSYDISPDGNRFLMRQLSDQPPQPVRQIQIVQNWFEELKRLVPASKK